MLTCSPCHKISLQVFSTTHPLLNLLHTVNDDAEINTEKLPTRWQLAARVPVRPVSLTILFIHLYSLVLNGLLNQYQQLPFQVATRHWQ